MQIGFKGQGQVIFHSYKKEIFLRHRPQDWLAQKKNNIIFAFSTTFSADVYPETTCEQKEDIIYKNSVFTFD